MHTLHELQQRFANALIAGDDAELLAGIASMRLSADRRINIYRNNFRMGLSEALRTCYPVVERLVGEDFFGHCAKNYVREYPSTSGNLHDYGRGFAVFLSAFPPVKTLPYLPAVAELEWLIQEVYHAPEVSGLDLVALAEVPAERQCALRFRLNPAARLYQSRYPVLRIWQVNQMGFNGDPSVNLDTDATPILIIRRDFEIELETLSAGKFLFLHALHKEEALLGAAQLAQEKDPDFDPGTSLQGFVNTQVLTGFYLD